MARTPWAPGAPALAAGARAVEAVVTRGRSAEAALGDTPHEGERAAVQAITFGTLRWYLRLAPALETLLSRPEGVSPALRALLSVAAHQIEYSRHAPELTVHAAVDAARLLGHKRTTALVNAVLRRFVEQRQVLLARVDAGLSARTAHPGWLVERIVAAWPEAAERVLAANNQHPPMTLRVDLSRSTAKDCLDAFVQADIDAREIQWMPSAVTLAHPIPVEGLPGFETGIVSVQDGGAQLAARLLGARPGMRVLDACAAPGGKTGHILEQAGGELDLTALDVDARRVGLIGENLRRLRRRAHLVVGDAREPTGFWDGRPFDRILVDAPCSSTGVIRRHPDIKLLRRAADLHAFAAAQLAILRAATAMLAPGGRLLYCTCSVLPEENAQVVSRLLEAEPRLRSAALPSEPPPGAVLLPTGLQLLPGAEAGTDGFYYACLEKTTAGA